VGLDWGSAEHAVCLLDGRGQVCGERRVAHTAAAVQEAIAWLRTRTGVAPAAIAVAIETPRGVLVDTLIEQGFAVFALNPKQLDRFRDRFTASGAKDDRRDAHALADGLRTDARAFRAVQPDDPAIIQLRELCRIVEELQEQEQRLANRLREQLLRIDAAWLALSPAADDPWLWTVLRETPDPAAWPRLARRRVATALRAHRIRRLTVDDVMAALTQPRLTGAPGVADAVALRIASLVPQLVLVHAQRTAAEQRIEQALDTLATATDAESREHRDVEILRSLPGVGRIVAATMLTEATAAMAARDYATLRMHGGAAPVTKRSGKRLYTVHMRYACKSRLRQALYHWARCSLALDPATRAYYDALRARGHYYARALRSVADRWLRILVAMLNARTLYDPSRPQCVAAVAA
jgi:transposase